MSLRLSKLPDRTPVKISITVSPGLNTALQDYCEVYRRVYPGQKESVADLIPFMLDAFMNADPGFKRARKELQDARPSSPPTQAKET